MTTADLLPVLLKLHLAVSAGVLIVLVLRPICRQYFGSALTYRLWWLVPAIALAAFIPARKGAPQEVDVFAPAAKPVELGALPLADTAPALPTGAADTTPPSAPLPAAPVSAGSPPPIAHAAPPASPVGHVAEIPAPAPVAGRSVAGTLFQVWLIGALTFAGLLAFRQWDFMRRLGRLSPIAGQPDHIVQASTDATGPALVGFIRPRIVLPRRFEQDFTADERTIIIAHEEIHRRHGDAQANGIAALITCLCWANPLVHLGVHRMRLDQELACDAHVIRRFPTRRRLYGETMLKDQLMGGAVPVGCHWHPYHPLKERLVMLKEHLPGTTKRRVGAVAITSLALGASTLAWAAQPPRPGAIVPIQNAASAPSLDLAQTTGPARTYDVDEVDLEDVRAVLTVIPEDRGDVAVETGGRGTLEVRTRNNRLVIQGQENGKNLQCRNADRDGIREHPRGTEIVLRVPRDVDVSAHGILLVEVGDMESGDIGLSGCGEATLGRVAGSLDLAAHGSMNLTTGPIGGELDIAMHGSTQFESPSVGGGLDMAAHGSTQVALGPVGGPADIALHGSGQVELGRIGGPLDAAVHGSGRLTVAEATEGAELALHGSANAAFGRISGPLDASLHGAAGLDMGELLADRVEIGGSGAARVTAEGGLIDTLQLDLNGGSNAKLDLDVKRAMVGTTGGSRVYLRSAATLDVRGDERDRARVTIGERAPR